MSKKQSYLVLSGLLALLVAAVGVLALSSGRTNPEVVTPEGSVVQTRLTTVFQMYTLFVQERGRAPKDAAELQKFTEELPPAKGGPLRLTPAFLTSPRDKKPVVIRYGLPLRPSPDDAAKVEGTRAESADGPVVAHEQHGSGGRRFVVYAESGRVEQVEATRARQLGLE